MTKSNYKTTTKSTMTSLLLLCLLLLNNVITVFSQQKQHEDNKLLMTDQHQQEQVRDEVERNRKMLRASKNDNDDIITSESESEIKAHNRKLSVSTALPAPIEYEATLFSSEEDSPKFMNIPLNERKAMNKIRYASFGSSSTWGAKLPHPKKQTYIKLLGNGDNYALRASGPNYPAACAKSMLQDKIYDVFILEFFDTAKSGLFDLAVRLREKFPDAIMILLVGKKFPWYHCGGDHLLMEEFQMAFTNFGVNHCHTENYKNYMRDHFRKHNCYGENNLLEYGPVWKSHYAYMKMIASETNSYILKQSKMEMTGEEYLAEFDRSKAEDCFHMSITNHAEVAHSIHQLIERIGVPKHPVVRDFHASDHCMNWFMTGEIDPNFLRYSPNGYVERIPNTEKFALQFRQNINTQHWIEVTNESQDQSMSLFVSHMTTGPFPNNIKYPRVSAHFQNQKIDLNPIADPKTWENVEQNVHVTNLSKIGRVGPGETVRVYFVIKEESEWPFRIVQVLFTPKGNYADVFIGVKKNISAGDEQKPIEEKKELRQG